MQHLNLQPADEDLAWRSGGAACAEADPALFFPETRKGVSEAKKICARCPLQTACLEYALTWNEEGIWGGLTQRQRAELRRARRLAA